ncbi:branched-chain amino acid transport system ATP-binding protein [Alkalibacillus filiformis]|uniref:Branched-chain amino acid transport system ATP-binding protein n=1 Tax=Alkalibacillus filiformis TaxID=200990 RepID=A0ABU0DQ54_9BACI|nr:ABC transporter ATP-binding protein [Alkalibacillus filiformis]MDQ0350495.1 branched-chain amino acid transport system ATP-binding protein [Alkalibacillus filiformis]
MTQPLLKLEKVNTYIEQFHILQDVNFEVQKGELTLLLGRNGAGKTTTLRTIMGLNPAASGHVHMKDEDITGTPTYKIAKKGIGYVPEDQGIFYELTVGENMRVAMMHEDDATKERLEWSLELFPDLKKFWKKPGGQLSGGQKQMLSIARAFVNETDLLLIDEPSKGLAPVVIEKVIEAIEKIKDHTTVVLVEQNFYMANRLGDRFYILDDGLSVHDGYMKELNENEELKRKYLGIG